jgi:DNA-binding GntR family transcriptional regulator
MARLGVANAGASPLGPRLEGKAGLIFDEVERRLANGAYPFGAEIVTAELVREFAASRAPVTMAMNLLRAAGYVTIRPQVGVWVVCPRDEEIVDFFSLYARTEGLHTANATRNAWPEAIAVLDLIEDQMRQIDETQYPGADREWRMLSALFHTQIRFMAATPWLCQNSASALRMSSFLIANRSKAEPSSAGRATVDIMRREIIARMKQGDAKAAGELMERLVMSRCPIGEDTQVPVA